VPALVACSEDALVERKISGTQTMLLACALALGAAAWAPRAMAEAPGDPKPVKTEDGKNFDRDGDPTYRVAEDGSVDYYTYAGYIRYAAECMRCHGPDGMGSSYGPTLANSLKRLSYAEFYATVAGGRQNVSSSQNLVMPALGADRNVMCYIDAIYVYLRARSHDAIGRGRPSKHDAKPAAYLKAEDECMK
jgi:methanol metabolism-related c-type cytochrome